MRDNEINQELREDSDPVPSHSGNGWQYFPTRIEDLHDEIRRRQDFLGISDVSRFASALMVALVREREERLRVEERLTQELERLRRTAHTHA
jgi:hypothetical protein